jgi:hypothetical protein
MSEVPKLWGPLGGAVGPPGGGRVVCMRVIFILNKIWHEVKNMYLDNLWAMYTKHIEAAEILTFLRIYCHVPS